MSGSTSKEGLDSLQLPEPLEGVHEVAGVVVARHELVAGHGERDQARVDALHGHRDQNPGRANDG